MSANSSAPVGFKDMGLPASLLKALDAVGYETPTPIQAETLPFLLDGHDLLGHAPTGTGKTAAFALPLLARLDLKKANLQVMVMTPTRELAIQVAEAFRRYASHMKGFHVLPVYGGQDYSGQTRQLKRGVHVVVGTPGRIMDHMRRGTLKLDTLQCLVLDEADEMLRMGFIDDIKWILEQSPDDRQLALFSATMPREIQRIARDHLNKPKEITIKTKTATADTIRQRFWVVSGLHKLDALTRLLEGETFDAVLVFVRTRLATTELSEKLEARGYSTAALNGDIPQNKREKIVEKLKNGKLDILVASDVAARGLDVERISHVINYDIPYDTEAYIHRIGRTGRAGRTGDAILFVTPREKRMLHAIEKATRQKIEPLTLPTTEMVNNRRVANFYQSITDTLAKGRHEYMRNLLQRYEEEHAVPLIDIAAALANLHVGEKGLLLKPEKPRRKDKTDHASKETRSTRTERETAQKRKPAKEKVSREKTSTQTRTHEKPVRDRPSIATLSETRKGGSTDSVRRLQTEKSAPGKAPKKIDNRKVDDKKNVDKKNIENRESNRSSDSIAKSPVTETRTGVAPAEKGMEWFRFEAGKKHKLKPATIIVTISNETGLDSEYIGRMAIEQDHTLVELPEGMPKAILQDLRKARICGEKMRMSRLNSNPAGNASPKADRSKSKKRKDTAKSSAPTRARNSNNTNKTNKVNKKPGTKKPTRQKAPVD